MVSKIVSGGQTGADRAALDVGLDLGLEVSGWCPRGRRAEDGPIPERYPLQELDSKSYAARTKKNVEDSDATLIITYGEPGAGSQLTIDHAARLGRPHLHLEIEDLVDEDAAREVRAWLDRARPGILNVAGSRESTDPGIARRVRHLLAAALSVSTPRERACVVPSSPRPDPARVTRGAG